MQRNVLRSFWVICPVMLGLFAVQVVVAQADSIEKVKPMAADADPSFVVSTIKPSDPNDPKWANGWSFEGEGRLIQCKRATVLDIITVIYGVQVKQVVGGPEWMSKDRYDISGVPDMPGDPNVAQFRSMFKKLLADRFHLVMHTEKREMPIYAITAAKGGPHLKVARPDEDLNAGNSGDGGVRTMKFTNMPMSVFAQNIQIHEDRPVVDQTGLSGRYDFTLSWTYDLSREGAPGAPPSLYTAMKEQLGLKIDAVKGMAEVLVIDRLERPSEN